MLTMVAGGSTGDYVVSPPPIDHLSSLSELDDACHTPARW